MCGNQAPMSTPVEELLHVIDQRIVVLDGAMGTMIEGLGFTDEAHWRGDRFATHSHSVKGCSDILVLTQPQAIEDIHFKFLTSGADIVETNTFTATSIALADYALEPVVRDINIAAAQVAR